MGETFLMAGENIGDGKYFENSSPNIHICFMLLDPLQGFTVILGVFFFRLVTTHALTSSFEYSLQLVYILFTEIVSLELVM